MKVSDDCLMVAGRLIEQHGNDNPKLLAAIATALQKEREIGQLIARNRTLDWLEGKRTKRVGVM